jgi:hypothetical protein
MEWNLIDCAHQSGDRVEVAANPEIRFLVIMLQLDKFFQDST